MSQIDSIHAYIDCQKLFDAATRDPKGARWLGGTYESCVNKRTRMNYFRKLDRKANKETYPPEHLLHGCSPYDPYVVRIIQDEDREFWVYVQPRETDDQVIEGLSEPHLQAPVEVDSNLDDLAASEIHEPETR